MGRDASVVTSSLLLDLSPWSLQRPDCWPRLVAAGPPWCGAILKASEGLLAHRTWFAPRWKTLGETELIRGAYTFLLVGIDGARQADVYLDAIEWAGGWSRADLWPIVDVELSAANRGATAAQVERSVEAFVTRVRERTGRDVVLYAGQWLAELGITSRMGCSWLFYPSYTERLDRRAYERIGWTTDRLLLWQYAGADGRGMHARLDGYPRETPVGDADINVLTLQGGLEELQRLIAASWAEDPKC